ncbi:hypothetical protein UAY_03082 [Enterococcus moraviensis ATCC BAA-383]|uniref:Uncharacterized protein n=3 Tax=Enterococcus moraviensis TaxID=155617 RepID=R2QHV8_9ENTE|nr:hypothetical protein UAY_03082 [Enterococcus moraviensis ATCC BAA-383]EOT66144.1 hypothetical protein I586_02415 [Enterococcus moraviensis ATCC BAA-383]OJG63599.1 hypothetical protein RV09_GL002281 [Enterococcus moraviensis]
MLFLHLFYHNHSVFVPQQIYDEAIPMIQGTSNAFKSTDTMKNGAKYEFQLSDGQKAIIRWHEPDPVAAAKFPNSASGSRWTAQIKIGNKQVTVEGLWTKKQNLNEVHVPVQGR